MENIIVRGISREDVRNLLLRNITLSVEHYLKEWRRTDGPSFNIQIEINPDLIEYAFQKQGEVEHGDIG